MSLCMVSLVRKLLQLGATVEMLRTLAKRSKKRPAAVFPDFETWVAEDRASRTYFEGLSPEEQARQIKNYRDDVDRLYTLKYPIDAETSGRPVVLLGPVEMQPGYKLTEAGTARGQMLFEEDGTTYSTLPGAPGITIDGEILVRTPARRDPRKQRGFGSGIPSSGEQMRYEEFVRKAIKEGVPVPAEIRKHWLR